MHQHLRKCQVNDTGQPPTQPSNHLSSLNNQTTQQQDDQPQESTLPSPESFYWGESKGSDAKIAIRECYEKVVLIAQDRYSKLNRKSIQSFPEGKVIR